jgi:hypothetical protein
LPRRFRSPIPKAGYVGIEPKNFCKFAVEQVDAVIGYTETVEREIPGGDLQRAYDELRRGRLQLTATGDTIAEAVEKNELSSRRAGPATDAVDEAHAKIDEAVETLLGDPSAADQVSALDLALSARETLENGFRRVRCR